MASDYLPRSPRLLTRLATLLLEDGQPGPGAAVLARLREVTPATDRWALLDLASRLHAYGNANDAVDVAKRAIGIPPANASVLRRAAEIFERAGDLPAAIVHLRAANQLEPDDDFIATELARVLYDVGNREAARSLAKTVLDRSPDDWSAQRLLERIGAPTA